VRSKKQYIMTWDAEDLASELDQYNRRYVSEAHNPIFKMWIRNTYSYYSTILDAQTWLSSLNFVGEQGELVKMSVPQARALVRQLLTLVTKTKLAFSALAQKSGSDVTESKRIANALATQTVKTQQMDLLVEDLVERALVQGTSFLCTRWRSDKGKPVAIADLEDGKQQVVYEGDIEISVSSVFDMLYDYSIENWADQNWARVRVKRNRWDLIAQHPELEAPLMKIPSICRDLSDTSSVQFDNEDMVYVYELYHKPTPALPRGRFLAYCDSKSILHDDINKFNKIPIEQYKPERIDGYGFGYPMLSNLLPAQEMMDHSYSCIATNQSALGVQNIAIPRDSGINVQQLYGMNFFEYTPQSEKGGGEPKPIDLLKSAPELFKLPETMLSNMQQMSFINAAVRGELPAGTSGVAIATLTTNALEFLNSYTKNLQVLLKETMQTVNVAYQKYATTERLVVIAGKNNQASIKAFKAEQLEPITGYEMEAVNPLMQTMAGRLDISEKMIQQGLVTDIQSYVSVLDGQPMNTLIATELSENDLIATENEKMENGEKVLALSTDKHPIHIYRHKELLNDPDIRADAERTALILEHIEEHNQLAKNTDPMLQAMAATGQMPPLPQGPPPGPAPQPEMMAQGDIGQAAEGPQIEKALPSSERAPDLLGRQ
jgi:hypothetical protein